LIAERQDEGYENDWVQANIKSMPVLRYKQTDIDGRPAPAPTRLQPEPPPAGIMGAAATIDNDIKTLMGIFDPAQLGQGNVSGKALNGQTQQMDLTNFDFYDNLTKSIAHVGKICLDLLPKIYDTQRVLRIIGDDGKTEMVTLNQPQQVKDDSGMLVNKVLNDVTVGKYDVVMDTGTGYNSKREAAVEAMMPLIGGNQKLMDVAGDLVFRNMDFPGADMIADRLAATNPLAQIDEKSDIPPQVQMQLAQNKQQMQQMQQQLQQLQMMIKQRQDIEQVKQEAETKRVLIKETNRAHQIELQDQHDHANMRMKVDGQAHDTVVKTQTQLEIERMKAEIAVRLAEIDRFSLKNASAETTERAI
jgi:hypothetical protein